MFTSKYEEKNFIWPLSWIISLGVKGYVSLFVIMRSISYILDIQIAEYFILSFAIIETTVSFMIN